MEFKNTEVWGFEHAIRGMRNPMNSWDKSDSHNGCGCGSDHSQTITKCDACLYWEECYGWQSKYIIGENDLKLMQTLIRAGSEHRKFLRQIFVSVDITAPLYWWKEFDTYKVGTVSNSTSTMHKIHAKEFTLDDFSHEYLMMDYEKHWNYTGVLDFVIDALNDAREHYLETKDKRWWWQMIQLLPSSYNQKRTITMNYENILAMYRQRKNHKLNEWSGIDNSELPNFVGWVKSLPYANELILIE